VAQPLCPALHYPDPARTARRFADSVYGQLRTATRGGRDIAASTYEQLLVQRCLAGDSNAYRDLVEQHQPQVATMMWRFARDHDTHEDLVQDVFVEAYANLHQYRGEAPFAHWLAGIATRTGYQYWRRQRRQKNFEAFAVEDWDQIADDRVDDLDPEDAGALLHRLLAHLPPRDRLVLTLRYVENKSVEEAAELTGWSQVMVKVQALRARKKLRALFDELRERES